LDASRGKKSETDEHRKPEAGQRILESQSDRYQLSMLEEFVEKIGFKFGMKMRWSGR